ncbi:hypothetical protein GGS23DRAFT_610834 [Durotheca rogersii]|uniref:uncharacterized protein n=1 Tax=Durotheca rogersii TaxID=419775 RepID=UPI0022212597|nr:uncharacterized protein GGS23DRAFT_610834 [Durotheca rogersii]KAI5862170.1 hypothetical protein GGS23DRAFT_610834 [Durotheca rogersii]
MCSGDELERLARAARLEGKLRQPENQLSALRLLQALVVKEIYAAKKQMGLVEARLRKIQEANTAEGRNDDIDKRLDELRKDKEGFRQLISEAGAAARDTKDDLESLRDQVSDEYVKLTADNVRFGKDVRALNKQVSQHQERIKAVESALDDFLAKLPPWQDELTKLNGALARLEPMVRSVYDKAGRQTEGTTIETVSEQEAKIRRFLDIFVPRQEKFLQFLEQLPARSSATLSTASESSTMISESLDGNAVGGGGGGGGRSDNGSDSRTSQLKSPSPLVPSIVPPEPPQQQEQEKKKERGNDKRKRKERDKVRDQAQRIPQDGDPGPPPEARRLLEQYNHFSCSYRAKRPKSEARFVGSFLRRIDARAARLLRERLGSPDSLRWAHVKNAMHRLDGRELFAVLQEGAEGARGETERSGEGDEEPGPLPRDEKEKDKVRGGEGERRGEPEQDRPRKRPRTRAAAREEAAMATATVTSA